MFHLYSWHIQWVSYSKGIYNIYSVQSIFLQYASCIHCVHTYLAGEHSWKLCHGPKFARALQTIEKCSAEDTPPRHHIPTHSFNHSSRHTTRITKLCFISNSLLNIIETSYIFWFSPTNGAQLRTLRTTPPLLFKRFSRPSTSKQPLLSSSDGVQCKPLQANPSFSPPFPSQQLTRSSSSTVLFSANIFIASLWLKQAAIGVDQKLICKQRCKAVVNNKQHNNKQQTNKLPINIVCEQQLNQISNKKHWSWFTFQWDLGNQCSV